MKFWKSDYQNTDSDIFEKSNYFEPFHFHLYSSMVRIWSFLFFPIILCQVYAAYESSSFEHVCGRGWQGKYEQLHSSIMSGKSEPKYFISVPVEAGLADIVFGYISGFLWALMTDRAYLIVYDPHLHGCQQRTVEFAYKHHGIDWRSPFINQSTYACMIPPYDSGSGRPCTTNPIAFNGKDNMTLAQIRAINGIPDEFKESNFLTSLKDRNVALFANNRGATYNMFKHPLYKDKLTEMGFKKETLFSCLFHFLFKINEDVCVGGCKTTEKALIEAGKEGSNTIRIGIQSRNPGNSQAPQHMSCAQELTQYYESQGKKVLYLLISANVNLQQSLKTQFGDKLVLAQGEPQELIQVHDRGPKDDGVHCDAIIKEDRQAMLDSARDVHLLSLTDIQIVSIRSGFGVFGAMARPHLNPILYRIEGQRTCADKLEGDDLQETADDWSGL